MQQRQGRDEAGQTLEDLMMDTLDAVSRFRVGQREAVGGALDAGGLLVTAKGRLPHGEWGDWLARVGLSPRTASSWMKLAGLELTAEEIIAQGGIRAVLSGKPRASKSASVADLRSDSELQRDLSEVEAAIGQAKRAYYDSLNQRGRLLRAIARQARGDGQ